MSRQHFERGRKTTHLVDQAIAWAARTRGADGISQAALRRSLPRAQRRSNCYVSHVVQLGDALTGVPPLELALYRSPRLTYAAIAKIVRRTKGVTEIRAALRQLIAEPIGPKGGPRPRRRRVAPAVSVVISPTAVSGVWDARVAAADPLRAVTKFARELQQLHREATAGLDAAVARRHQRVVLAGQSLASLMTSVHDYRANNRPATRDVALLPSEQRAMDELKHLGDVIDSVARGGRDLELAQPQATAPEHRGG